MSIIVKNLNYKMNDKQIFNNISLEIHNKEFVNLIIKSNEGKTLFSKLLTGYLDTKNEIMIENNLLNKDNLAKIRYDISLIPDNINNIFIKDTVYEEITFVLKNLNYNPKVISKLVDEYIELFDIKKIINRQINTLSGGEKYKVALISNLIHSPKFLIIDTDFGMLDNYSKKFIYDKLLYLIDNKNISIINLINSINLHTISSRNIFIDNGDIILDGYENDIFEHEDLLQKSNFKFPTILDLSYKLKLYNLVSKLHTNNNELMEDIWK